MLQFIVYLFIQELKSLRTVFLGPFYCTMGTCPTDKMESLRNDKQKRRKKEAENKVKKENESKT